MDESTIYKNKAAILDVFYTVLYKNNENISPNPETLLGVDSNKNPFYYINLIDNFSNVMNEKFLSDSLINNIKEIEKFNYALIDLTKELVNFFIEIYAFDGKDNSVIRLSESNVNQSFKDLSRHILLINSYMSIKDFSTSVHVRDYFLYWTEKSIDFLYNNLYLDIEKSSFKVNFDNIILKFKNSITIEEINIREKVNNKISRTIKIPEKWFALLYWFELSSKRESPPIDSEGAFIKREIMAVGKVKCKSTGQSFYNNFKSIDINDERLLKRTFGSDWKEQIIKLSNNDEKIIAFLKHKYDN